MRNLLLMALMLLIGCVGAQESKAQKDMLTNDAGVAIGGYDVVAYFTQNVAIRGSKKHGFTHNGTTFYFSSEDHKKQFAENPTQYLPQYGGHCAFAMAVGNGKVPSDPETFKLYDGQLYLFFNDYYEGSPFNTIVPWNADESSLKIKADANWKAL